MRILIIGRSKNQTVESGLRRALRRLGHTVDLVDDRKARQRLGRRGGNAWIRLRRRMVRPEHVLVFKPEDVQVELMHEIEEATPTVMWYRDLRVRPDPVIAERAQKVATLFLTAGGQAPEWERLGVRRALWLPNAADRDLDRPAAADARLTCDVAFIGRGVGLGEDYSRAELLCRLAEKFHVRVWGTLWQRWAKQLNWDGTSADSEKFRTICASAKIVIDIMPALWTQSRVGAYSSNRMVRTMACGGFCLSQAAPGLRELFLDGEHCAWFDTEAEAVGKIEYYLRNEAERVKVAQGGREFVNKHHMLDDRVHNLLTGAPYVNPLRQT